MFKSLVSGYELKEMDSVLLALRLLEEAKQLYGKNNIPTIEKALEIASKLHLKDFRKAPRVKSVTPPYIEHPLRVALRPLVYFPRVSQDVVIVGLLHDTVEDHALDIYQKLYGSSNIGLSIARKISYDFYQEYFGFRVAELVEKLTNPILPGTLSKQEKREAYLQHVQESIAGDDEAVMVKFCDFVDNAGSLEITLKKDSPALEHLLAKYTPMIPFFQEQIGSLYSGVQQEAMLKRLRLVNESFERLKG